MSITFRHTAIAKFFFATFLISDYRILKAIKIVKFIFTFSRKWTILAILCTYIHKDR